MFTAETVFLLVVAAYLVGLLTGGGIGVTIATPKPKVGQ